MAAKSRSTTQTKEPKEHWVEVSGSISFMGRRLGSGPMRMVCYPSWLRLTTETLTDSISSNPLHVDLIFSKRCASKRKRLQLPSSSSSGGGSTTGTLSPETTSFNASTDIGTGKSTPKKKSGRAKSLPDTDTKSSQSK